MSREVPRQPVRLRGDVKEPAMPGWETRGDGGPPCAQTRPTGSRRRSPSKHASGSPVMDTEVFFVGAGPTGLGRGLAFDKIQSTCPNSDPIFSGPGCARS
jgi:hypothetical protein